MECTECCGQLTQPDGDSVHSLLEACTQPVVGSIHRLLWLLLGIVYTVYWGQCTV